MALFNANKVLPKSVCIDENEDHLYRIGLCLTTKTSLKRNAFHSPTLVLIVNFSFLLKTLICIQLEDINEEQLLFFGDFSHSIGIRWHFNIACAFYTGFAVILQIIHFHNHWKGIEPNYLNVFEMMSGLRSPKSIGLTDEQQVLNLTKTTKEVLWLARVNTQITIPVFSFCMAFVLFLFYCPLEVTLSYGMVGALHYAWACYYVYNIHVFEVIYFYVICRYIKYKIKNQNQRIKVMSTESIRKTNSIIVSMDSLNSIYSEVYEFDQNFWSKFLIFVWFMYGNVIVLSFFMIFFSPMSVINRIGFSYLLAIILVTFLFIMNTAASVNLTAFTTYNIINKVVANHYLNGMDNRSRHTIRKLKLLNFIQEIGERRVGFSCLHLFTINYFRFYEIVIYLMALFLKVVQMSQDKPSNS